MRVIINNEIDNTNRTVQLPPGLNPVRVGRDTRNNVVLESHYVSGEAGAIFNQGHGWQFWTTGEFPCEVNERTLNKGQHAALNSGQVVKIYPFTLTIFLEQDERVVETDPYHRLAAHSTDLIRQVHASLNQRMIDEFGADADDSQKRLTDAYILNLETKIDELGDGSQELPHDDFEQTELGDYLSGHAIRNQIIRHLIQNGLPENQEGDLDEGEDNWSRMRSANATQEKGIKLAVDAMLAALRVQQQTDLTEQLKVVGQRFWALWREVCQRKQTVVSTALRRYLAYWQVKKEIKDIWYGFGPLQDLLDDPTINEIMVNDCDHIYIEKDNVLENSGRRFVSDQSTRTVIEKIVRLARRRIDESEPLVDARIPKSGSRVNAIIPPLAVKGPCLTIRRFPKRRLEIDDLIRIGSLTAPARDFLRAAVRDRRNVLVSGGTGTGKTTLLNCLSEFIPDKERIVTIEDTAELRLQKEHVVTLETKQKNIEGAGGFEIRALVKNALRMRPDRIVVGECRGAEALDMLQAMNTGHDGSMTTIHANNPGDVVGRLEVLVQQNADTKLTLESIHRMISSAIDLIVQLRVVKRGNKKLKVVSEIAEVLGMEDGGGVRMKSLFARADDSAELLPTGYLPTFIGRLIEDGHLNLGTFLRPAAGVREAVQ